MMFRLCPDVFLKWLAGYSAGIKRTTRKQAKQIALQVPKDDFLQIWKGIANSTHLEKDYRFGKPMLLAHGRFDDFVGLGMIKRLAPAWMLREENCFYEVIPDAGHNACNDNPEFFNRLLLEFLGLCNL